MKRYHLTLWPKLIFKLHDKVLTKLTFLGKTKSHSVQ